MLSLTTLMCQHEILKSWQRIYQYLHKKPWTNGGYKIIQNESHGMPASKRFSYLVPIVIFPNISAFPSARLKDCWRFWIMTWLSSLGRSDTPPSLACRKKQCGEMLRDNTRCHEIPGNLMCLSVVTSVLLSVVANGDWWRRGGKRRRRRWEWEWRRKKCTVINGHYMSL